MRIGRGTALALLAGLTYLLAWNRGISLLYGMFALLAATLAVARWRAGRSLHGLEARRSLPSAAFENDEIEIVVTLANRSRRTRYMIETRDGLPCASQEQQAPTTFVGRLGGGGVRRLAFKVRCIRRGEYRPGPLRVQSAYPLGIVTAEKITEQERPTLLVYPEITRLSALPPFLGRRELGAGEFLCAVGQGEEFSGTREYRRGDSLRHVHWPSSARHGELIVKEFERRTSSEMTLLLDLHRFANVGAGREATLEYAVKVAASIASQALEHGQRLQVVGYGRRPWIVPYGRGPAQLVRVLDTLARVEADGAVDYASAIGQGAGLLNDGGVVLLLVTCRLVRQHLAAYLQALDLLRAKRMRVISVFLDREGRLIGRPPDRQETALLEERLRAAGSAVYDVRPGRDWHEAFAR